MYFLFSVLVATTTLAGVMLVTFAMLLKKDLALQDLVDLQAVQVRKLLLIGKSQMLEFESWFSPLFYTEFSCEKKSDRNYIK